MILFCLRVDNLSNKYKRQLTKLLKYTTMYIHCTYLLIIYNNILFFMNTTTIKKTTGGKNLVIRIDPDLNLKSKEILKYYGLTQSGYVKLILKKLVNTKQLNVDYSRGETELLEKWETEKSSKDFVSIPYDQAKKEIDWLE